MQPALSALPKFHSFRQDPHAAPEVRHRNPILALKSLLHLFHLLLQLLPPLQHRALRAGPCAYARASDAGIVVNLTLLVRQPLHRSLDADLSLLLVPPEREAGLGVIPHVLGLSAGGPIAVYHKAPAVELLQVNEPGRDFPGWEGGGGEADGLGLMDPAAARESEPSMELIKRRGNELRPIEGAFGVLVRLGVDGGTGRCD